MSRLVTTLLVLVACGSPKDTVVDGAPADAIVFDAVPDAVPHDAPDAVGLDDAALPRDPFVELQALPGLCTTDEWCWAWPTPTGNRYFSVYATGPDNIWLTGGNSTVLQWDGSQWRRHQPPTAPGQTAVQEPWPYKVHGRSATDMWLIYGSTLQHWNGATWTIVQTGSFGVIYYRSIWIAPNGDVWVTTYAGLERSHASGPFEVILPGNNFNSIWGVAADDFFVTRGAGILHYDGQGFATVFFDPAKSPGSFQGTKNDAWVSGTNNTFMHWDGTAWTPVATGLAANALIYSVGWRASNDVWWYGGGSFLHWDGTSLTTTAIVDSAGERGVYGVTMVGDTWWLVGLRGGVYTKVGANALEPIISPQLLGSGLWGTSDTDMYVGSGGALRHWNGTTMTVIPIAITVGGVKGVAGAGVGGANELFAIGYEIDWTNNADRVYSGLHFDGLTWTQIELLRVPNVDAGTRYLTTFHAIGPGEAMAVGTQGLAFHYRNGDWTAVSTGVTSDLAGVWGPDADNLWISGANGTLLRWHSSNPNVMTPDSTFPATTNNLGTIHGADGILWIANVDKQFVSRRNVSGTWSMVGTNVLVFGVFAVSATNVVATTHENGRISRWNGTEFVLEDHGYETGMFSVFQPPGGKMWLTNGNGIVQHP